MTMPSISKLPSEIVLLILGNLNPFDLEDVVKCHSTTLSNPARLLLKQHRVWVKNATEMDALFGTDKYSRCLLPSFPGHVNRLFADWNHERRTISDTECDNVGLDRSRGAYYRTSPPNLRSWMIIDGTFSWLSPIKDKIAKSSNIVYKGPDDIIVQALLWKLESVIGRARNLGLVLPVGFETFFRSSSLLSRIPSTHAWFFSLGKIIKCPPVVDDGSGGYMLRFYMDQQGCAYAYLYLSPSGSHCVLYSEEDLDEDMQDTSESDTSDNESSADDEDFDQDEDDEGSDQDEDDDIYKDKHYRKNQFFLVGLTFEEYMVATYFEGLLNFRDFSAPGVRDYVKHTYRPPAEVAHMRPYNSKIDDFFQNIGDKWKAQ